MLIPMQTLHDVHGVTPKGVVHLGAHLGEEAPDYAAAGVERAIWVEGNPELIGPLTNNVSRFPGHRAMHAVVSDTDGAATTFRFASFTMSSSILPMTGHLRQYPSIVEVGTMPCESITIDSLMAREGEDPSGYDMLNVDLEGAELMAIRGASALLPFIKWVYAEVYFEDLYEGCALVEELDAYLGDRGFKRTLTEDAYYLGEFKGFGDALYTRQ